MCKLPIQLHLISRTYTFKEAWGVFNYFPPPLRFYRMCIEMDKWWSIELMSSYGFVWDRKASKYEFMEEEEAFKPKPLRLLELSELEDHFLFESYEY